jgi:hypothetical protein
MQEYFRAFAFGDQFEVDKFAVDDYIDFGIPHLESSVNIIVQERSCKAIEYLLSNGGIVYESTLNIALQRNNLCILETLLKYYTGDKNETYGKVLKKNTRS